MSMETIAAELADMAENARKHIEVLVTEHLTPIHAKLAEAATEAEKLKTSPIVSEVEKFLPPEIVAAIQLVENALIGAAQVTAPPAGDPTVPVAAAAPVTASTV